MPTVRTVTVKSSGGDYSSLSAAEAGEQGNLVGLDRQLNIECYASAAPDTVQVTIDGWTTDSTRYIDIYAPAGERHVGVWNTGKYYLELTTTGDPGGVFTVREDYTRLEYLQVRNTKSSPAVFNECVYAENITYVNACITRGGFYGVDLGAGLTGDEILNTVCYGGVRGAFMRGTAGGFGVAYNCNLIGSDYGLVTTASVNYPVAKNVYVHGGTLGFGTSSGGLVTKTNCMSSDTTATDNSGGGGATNCTNSVAHSTANFTNVTGGSEDYHLVSGSALIDAGVDLSGTFTNDFDGTTRPQNSVYDVGADEYAAGGSSLSRTATDGPTTSESVTRTFVGLRTTTDAPHTAESDARVLSLPRTLTDGPTTLDTASRLFTGSRAVTDSLSLSESVLYIAGKQATTTDSMATPDTTSRSLINLRSTTESLTLSQLLTRQGTFVRVVANNLNLLEVVIGISSEMVTGPSIFLTNNIQRTIFATGIAQRTVVIGSGYSS